MSFLSNRGSDAEAQRIAALGSKTRLAIYNADREETNRLILNLRKQGLIGDAEEDFLREAKDQLTQKQSKERYL